MKTTTSTDLLNLWERLGIQSGSTLLCHSFLPSLGKVLPDANLVRDSLLELLGSRGTLCAPTFTYSYFRGQVYDLNKSPSTVGEFGNIVRTHPEAIRSLDPNFSHASIGHNAPNLMRRDTKHSFGTSSFYDKFIQQQGHVLLLGVDFTALPLFMHCEKGLDLPYRYDKEFSGLTQIGEQMINDTAIHFVRDENLDLDSNRRPIGEKIYSHAACIREKCGYGMHTFVPANLVTAIVAEHVSKDPYFLVSPQL